METLQLVNTKNTVLIPWAGSKRAFTNRIQNTIDLMNLKEINYFIDGFAGALGFTINNIYKFNARNYIINDLDWFLISTYRALKIDFKKVIYHYESIINEFYSLDIPDEVKEKNSIPAQYRLDCSCLKDFYKSQVERLNSETDIFKVAALLIWKMKHTVSGMLQYKQDNTIDDTSFNWKYKVQSKVKHIEHYSNILNQYDVVIEQLDIFELLKKYPQRSNSFIYLDPGYLEAKHLYSKDASIEFHKKLLEETNGFKYRLYSNEDCKTLYKLKMDRSFEYYLTFPRNSNITKSNSKGREFLGYSINDVCQNNIVYTPKYKEVS